MSSVDESNHSTAISQDLLNEIVAIVKEGTIDISTDSTDLARPRKSQTFADKPPKISEKLAGKRAVIEEDTPPKTKRVTKKIKGSARLFINN